MLKKVLTSIWFLALIIAVPAIIILPPFFNQYKVKLISKDKRIYPFTSNYFYDLDSDGIEERIEGYGSSQNTLSFQCFTAENRLIEQYNYPNFYQPSLTSLFFADADNNNFAEVYGFTVIHDSVFLNWIEPLNFEKQSYTTRFITTIDTKLRKTLDVSCREVIFYDFDSDGITEMVFSLTVGFNLYPRRFYVFDFDSDTLIVSDMLGSNPGSLLNYDIDSDGEQEILSGTFAACNIPDSIDIPYRDNRPWFFVVDKNLKMKYPPIHFPPGLASYIHFSPVTDMKGELIVLYHNYSFKNTATFFTRFNILNPGNADTLFLNSGGQKKLFVHPESENEFIVFFNRGKVFRINTDLQVLDSIDLKFTSDHWLQGAFDLDGNSMNEYFVVDYDLNELTILLNGFKRKIEVEIEEPLEQTLVYQLMKKNNFMVIARTNLYFYELVSNPYYILKYPAYILIYFISVLFIWIIQTIRIRQLEEKFRLQNQVRELQMKSLKNQLDPHFMYNTFNTIASVIKQGRKDEAYDLFILLSKMVRTNLDSSNEIYTTLKGELDFVKDYLIIQKFRFKELFEYTINVEKNVDSDLKIPKMLMQIHIENALKHGIRNLKTGGLLQIRVFKGVREVKIEIEDNGIGREKSRLLNSGNEGIGLKTIQQIIELNNQKGKNRISQKISNVKNEEGKTGGTLVVLSISWKN